MTYLSLNNYLSGSKKNHFHKKDFNFRILCLYIMEIVSKVKKNQMLRFKKKNLLENLQNEEFELINKIEDLEIKNSLLTNNLDLDYIETLIRQKFLFGKKEETLYIIKSNDN